MKFPVSTLSRIWIGMHFQITRKSESELNIDHVRKKPEIFWKFDLIRYIIHPILIPTFTYPFNSIKELRLFQTIKINMYKLWVEFTW